MKGITLKIDSPASCTSNHLDRSHSLDTTILLSMLGPGLSSRATLSCSFLREPMSLAKATEWETL
ncbi:hypothetical protein U0070_025270 [Myodes glareolus]|uniref:Uncharacterized protein n=1 Tax=Myodes glareolus TaxID=447135 RepID=A0AAW0IMC9_MYOGA